MLGHMCNLIEHGLSMFDVPSRLLTSGKQSSVVTSTLPYYLKFLKVAKTTLSSFLGGTSYTASVDMKTSTVPSNMNPLGTSH